MSVITRIKIGTHIHRIELGLKVGSYEQEHGTHGKDQGDNALAPERQPANDCSHSRSAKRRDKPAADHGQHTRDTINGGLTIPGAVGKARAHRNHKGHVRRRQRKLQACRRSNQYGTYDQVDRGANIVKRQRCFAML